MSTITYHGTWDADAVYGQGALVTRAGGLFLYNATQPQRSSTSPGDDGDHWSALAASESRADTFVRPDQVGWGTASDGHLWTVEGPTDASTAFISSNTGIATANLALDQPTLYLGDAFSAVDVEVTLRFGVYAVGQGSAYLLLRALPGLDTYARISFDVYGQALELRLYDHGLGSFEGTFWFDWTDGAPDTIFRARFRAEGQRYRARVWTDGDSEPSTWPIDYTASATLSAGSVAFQPGTLTTGQVKVYGFTATAL